MNIRPGVQEFLEQLSPIYEIIVFTASEKCYADKILDCIDIRKKWIHHRLYRENCIQYSESVYFKDLRVLERDLRRVIIVDNAPYAFAPQLENGYPIIPFYDSKEDEELPHLAAYLRQIQHSQDVRLENRQKFKLKELCDYSIDKYIKFYQPGNSDLSSGEQSASSHQAPIDSSTEINPKVKSALAKIQHSMAQMYEGKQS